MNCFLKRVMGLILMACMITGGLPMAEEWNYVKTSEQKKTENVLDDSCEVDFVLGYGNGRNKEQGKNQNSVNGQKKGNIVKYKEKKNNTFRVNKAQGHGYENSKKSWNRQMIHATVDKKTEEEIKVAIIDSGINYSTDLNVVIRKNFIYDDERSTLYEDLTGHGTAVAGIIGALDNEEGITGMNPGVALYSARVLDGNLEAPVERVVEAIDWAIEQNVDIINMSFGITKNVDELEAAIKRAADAGILLIAATGKGNEVSYPAAYEEVIAVGSVTSEGKPAEDSAVGGVLELMAPGENILSSGIFGGVRGCSGTSMAAPHVAGAASTLMELNPDMSAQYIRELLNYSANLYGDSDEYGNGVIDLEYAIEINDEFKALYEKHLNTRTRDKKGKEEQRDKFWEEVIASIPENVKTVEVFEDVEKVEGFWLQGNSNHQGKIHKDFVIEGVEGSKVISFTDEQMKILTYACGFPDSSSSGLSGTGEPYHGHLWEYKKYSVDGTDKYVPINESNYIANFVLLTRIADVYGVADSLSGAALDNLEADIQNVFESATYMYENDLKKIRADFQYGDRVGKMTWEDAFEKIDVAATPENIKYFIYGIAIHTITDVYAHSTFSLQSGKWKRVKHNNNNFSKSCDNATYIPERWKAAQGAASSVLVKLSSGLKADLLDFYRSGSPYGKFYLGNLSAYAQMVDPVQYLSVKNLLSAGDLYNNRKGKTIVYEYENDFKSGSIFHECRPILTPSVY